MSLFSQHQSSTAAADADRTIGSPRSSQPAFSDGLGERQRAFDNATGATIEMLRLRKELGESPGFEAALRKRVDDLQRLLHPSLATLHGVERLPQDSTLALISNHVPGRRLSEILQSARGPVFAVELLRQLTPALATIQRLDPSFAHGVFSADRIIVTREGRLIITEYALGSAIESLRLPPAHLRKHFGLAVGDDATLDQRSDVVQLGFVALSLLLGRRIDPQAFSAGIPSLLDEFAAAAPREAARMRPWFERALQVSGKAFDTADDALETLDDLPEPSLKEPQRTILMFRPPAEPADPLPAEEAALAEPEVTEPETDGVGFTPTADDGDAAEELTDDAATEMTMTARPSRKLVWAVAGLALVCLAQGVVIASLMMKEPSGLIPSAAAAPLYDGTSDAATTAGSPPDLAALAGAPGAAGTTQTPPPVPPPLTSAPAAEAPAAAPLAGRFGGVRITSPFEVQVFEDGAALGSSAGPIAMSEGSYTLDLVNEELGVRSRQSVSVRAGQLTAVRLTPPQGRININATPWATVWIDGNSAGDTPLANLSLPVGRHEVVFRHPQLGEQRVTAVVKADEVARISANLQR
jgi:hypothetical protein